MKRCKLHSRILALLLSGAMLFSYAPTSVYAAQVSDTQVTETEVDAAQSEEVAADAEEDAIITEEVAADAEEDAAITEEVAADAEEDATITEEVVTDSEEDEAITEEVVTDSEEDEAMTEEAVADAEEIVDTISETAIDTEAAEAVSDEDEKEISDETITEDKADQEDEIIVSDEDNDKKEKTETEEAMNEGEYDDYFMNADEVNIGDTLISLTSAEPAVYKKFIAPSGGEFLFNSKGNDCDPYLEVYNDAYEQIGYDDDGAGDSHFSYSLIAEAGKTYYLRLRTYSNDTSSYTLSISKGNSLTATALNDKSEIYLSFPGDEAELTVEASVEEGNIYYQWQMYDNENESFTDIQGANEASYTVSVEAYKRFRCLVTDDFGTSAYVYFYVDIADNLTTHAKDYEDTLYASPGEEITLEVEATVNQGNIRYQWYKYEKNTDELDGVSLEGETSNTLTIIADSIYHYFCEVSDDYGNIHQVSFYIKTNTLSTTYESDDSFYIESGETATMKVSAEASYGDITYQWYRNGDPIDGATGTSYTTSKSGNYICRISAEDYESTELSFEVNINSSFSCEIISDDYFTIIPGEVEEAVLEVSAEADTAITYSWYRGGELISGAEGHSYTASKAGSYTCKISDEDGHEASIYFDVNSESWLSIYEDEATINTVKAGETAYLEVQADGDTEGLTYTWFDEDDNVITGETSSIYEPEVTKQTSYRCLAENKYGDTDSVWIYVYIDNSLYASAVQDSFTAPYGSQVTLEADAEVDSGDIHYNWYKAELNDDGYYDWVELSEAGPSLEVTAEEYSRYFCVVSDDYGNEESLQYYIYIENNLMAEAKESDITITPGESALLEVEASADSGNLSYTWYENWENEIEGETSASCQVTPGRNTSYTCIVKDDFSNIKEVSFDVRIDNNFTAVQEVDTFTVSPGTAITLKVNASSSDNNINYQWYKVIYDEGYKDNEIIDGATEATYDITVEKAGQYICYVSDNYGNNDSLLFTVNIDNSFEAEAVNPSVTTAPGSSVTLEVNASAANGDIHYNWYRDYELIEDETSSTFTYEPTYEESIYCIVEDAYGNRITVYFEVEIDNELTAEAVNDYFNVEPGTEVTLEVDASVLKGDIHYTWYQRVPYDDGYTYSEIDGENSESLIITADKTNKYYCYVIDDYGNYESVYFTVEINNNFTARAKKSSITAAPGDEVQFEVIAEASSGTISYQWYSDDDGILDGETSSTLTMNAEKVEEYYCLVKDEYNNSETIWFNLHIDNNFSAYSDQTSFTVDSGDDVTMNITASADSGSVHYKWYEYYEDDYEYVLIEGEEGSSLTRTADSNSTYYCYVYDDYGNRKDIYFYIYIDNNLTAEGKTGTYYDDNEYWYISVNPGESVDLMVEASCTTGQIHYTWYEYYYENDIVGTDSPVYSLTPEKSTRYKCVVKDDYGNRRSILFRIYIDNEFSASAEEDEIYTSPGQDVTLHVNASAKSGNITYLWVKKRYFSDGSYFYDIIDDNNSPDLNITVTKSESYTCSVSDEYNNNIQVQFEVYVENNFSAYSDQTSFTVNSGDDVTMSITASADSGSVHYKWYEYYDDDYEYELIEGEEGSSLTKTADSYSRYYCYVYDDYGNRDYIYFYIYINNNLTAEGKTGTYYDDDDTYWYVNVNPEESVDLTVEASCTTGQIHYTWYNGYDDYDEDDIVGDDSPVLSISPDRSTWYTCVVKDDYGNRRSILFRVGIDNNFSAEAENENVIVSYGSDAVLNVIASCNKGPLAYEWYIYNEDDDKYYQLGETGRSLTVHEVKEYTKYKCIASDNYGSTENLYFYVEVENNFTAEQEHYTVNIEPGESGTLRVIYTSANGEPTFKWLDPDDEEIEGAASSELVVNKSGYYSCYVTDPFGKTISLGFEVVIDNEFIVSSNYGDYDWNDVYTSAGDDRSIEVTASCKKGRISYQWLIYDDDEDDWINTGITSNTYNLKDITEYTKLRVIVSDKYSEEQTITYEIYPSTDFAVNYIRNITLSPGESKTLHVEVVTSDKTTPITYTWYIWDDDEETWTTISGAASDSYEISDIREYCEYKCHVEQGDNDTHAVFRITPLETLNCDYYSKEIVAEKATDVELVTSVTSTLSDVKYEWYHQSVDEDHKIAATGSTISVNMPEGNDVYYCLAYDEYNGQKYSTCTITFNLYEKGNVNTADSADDAPQIYYNEAKDAFVKGKTLVYFKFIPDMDGEYFIKSLAENDTYGYLYDADMNQLESDDDSGNDTNFMITYDMEAGKVYYIGVRYYSDEREGIIPVLVTDDNAFTANAQTNPKAVSSDDGDEYIVIPENGSAVMTVSASCRQGTLHYKWNMSQTGTIVNTVEETGSSSTVTVPYSDTYDYCECRVTDDYGNKAYFGWEIRKAEAHTHVPEAAVVENETAATCTADGSYDEVVYCEICGQEISRTAKVVPALGHISDGGTVTKQATCTEEGVMTFKCSRCGMVMNTQTIEKTLHSLEAKPAVPATCTATGMKAYYECSVCHKLFEDEGATKEVSLTELVTEMIPHTPAAAVQENETDATCLNAGGYDEVIYCSACSKELSRTHITIDPTGHAWGEWTETRPATDLEEGEEQRTCSNDPTHVETRTIPKIGHVHAYVKVDGQPASCSATGIKEHYTCSGCNKLFIEDGSGAKTEVNPEDLIIAKTSHTPKEAVRENETAAECEKDGSYESVVYCSVCNAEISRTTNKIAALGHKPDSGTVTKQATCTEEGVMTFKCSRCKEVLNTQAIEKIPHNLEAKPAVPATCTVDGVNAHYACSVCHKLFADSAGAQVVTADSLKINKLSHTPAAPVKENEKKATCTQKGSYDEVVYCSTCKAEISRTAKESPAAGHKSDSGTVTAKATCTAEGVKTYKCIVCNNILKTEKIAKTAHTIVNDASVAATCEKAGKTAGTHCSVCNTVIKAQKTVPAAGHKSDNGTVTKEATYTSEGEKTYKCTVCGKVIKTETIPMLVEGQPVSPANAPDLAEKEKEILNNKSDEAPEGASFNLLQLKAAKATKNSITLKWTKVKSARGYIIYGAMCGQTYAKLGEVGKGSTVKFISNKLKPQTSYKYYVVAYTNYNGARKQIAASQTIHVFTAGKKKAGNYTSIKLTNVKKNKLTLNVKKTFKIKAKAVTPKKTKVKQHRALRYESSNSKIATVNKKNGKIKGISKGKCVIYVYAQNGIFKKIKVTVK